MTTSAGIQMTGMRMVVITYGTIDRDVITTTTNRVRTRTLSLFLRVLFRNLCAEAMEELRLQLGSAVSIV